MFTLEFEFRGKSGVKKGVMVAEMSSLAIHPFYLSIMLYGG